MKGVKWFVPLLRRLSLSSVALIHHLKGRLHLTFPSWLNILMLFSLMDDIVVLIQCTPSAWHPYLGAEIYSHTAFTPRGVGQVTEGSFSELKSRRSVLGE